MNKFTTPRPWPWLALATFAAYTTAGCTATQPAPSSSPAPVASTAAPEKSPRSYHLTTLDTWGRSDHGSFETFVGPDPSLRVHVLEGSWKDLDVAVREAWKTAAPTMALKERRRASGAPDARFSEQLVVTYSDDTEEHIAQAIAMRHATRDRVYIFLVEGPMKELGKRGAELSQLVSSLEVDGAARLTVRPEDVHEFDAARQRAFFASVEEIRQLAGVTGVAVGVVTPAGTFTRGFGKRSGDGAAVDGDTQFMIGSVTKSFSTLLLATLVDDGKLAWESTASSIQPAFHLADAERTKLIQIQHLFCACTGAPRQDMELLFDFAEVLPKDMFDAVGKIQLTTALGETFQYNNQLTAVGGYIAGGVAFPNEKDVGRAYARALATRVLEPLGMKDSMLDPKLVVARGNFALPHMLDWSGETTRVDLPQEEFALPVAPAGALWSTANDMARYIRLQLGKGVIDGRRVVSEKNLTRTQTPQIKVSDDESYGMGWLIGKMRGLDVVQHGGGTMGFNTSLLVLPQIGVGLFVVANRSPAAMNGAVRERLLEVLFETPPRAVADLKQNFGEMKRLMKERKNKVSTEPVSRALLGKYRSEQLGAIEIASRDGGTVLDVGEWTAGLGVLDPQEQANTLVLTSGPLQGATLLIDDKQLIFKQSQTDYVFKRE